MNQATTITGEDQIRAVQLLSARSALRLQMRTGLKHSKMNVRKAYAVHLGMKPNAKIEDVIARIEQEVDKINEKLGIEKRDWSK